MKQQREEGLTENIVIRVSQKEKGMIARCAEKEGVTVSQYGRAVMLTDLAMIQGDREAIKMLLVKAQQAARDRMQWFYDALRQPGFSMTKVVVEANRKLFR